MEEKQQEIKQIGEGILVGLLAGLVVVPFRFFMEHAEAAMKVILATIKGHFLLLAGWFIFLALLAFLVSRLLTFEPAASGSGIPQLEAEHQGQMDPVWWRVLLAKFAGCLLSVFGGLVLGRCGPSVQLGAMAGKGVSRGLHRGPEEEELLKTCGASAGMAAIFHAPLAGAVYAMEQIHKGVHREIFLPALGAAIAADFLVTVLLGTDTIFQLGQGEVLSPSLYLLLLLLGILLGIIAALYDEIVLFVKSLYDRATGVPSVIKMMIPFLLAGVVGCLYPNLLGSGHTLIDELTQGDVLLSFMILVILARILLFAISFGSGAPGGIFFPLLVLGGYIGGAFATVCIQQFGLDASYFNTLIILAMGGFFSAVVRTPLTSIVLIFELTGSFTQLLPLAFISLVSYMVASFLKPKSISDSLRDDLVKKQQASSCNS